MITTCIVVAVPFFGCRRVAVRAIIALLLAAIAATGSQHLLNRSMFGADTLPESLTAVIHASGFASVWIPYFVWSKRVRNTFIKGPKASQEGHDARHREGGFPVQWFKRQGIRAPAEYGLEDLKFIVSVDAANLDAHTASGDKEITEFFNLHAQKRLPIWRKAAELGIPDGEFLYGCCLNNGFGVATNGTDGTMWLLRAAEQGSVIDYKKCILRWFFIA